MSARPKQLKLAIRPRFSHGGRRAGAGRKRRTQLQSHVARPKLSDREPVHVTLKLRSGLPSLRRKDVFRCLREAIRKAQTRGFFIAHYAILSNHIHLILEPRGKRELGRWMQSLCIAFARRLNRLMGCAGSVFEDRYHLHPLRTPTEVKRALAYVLSNESKHEHKSQGRVARATKLEVRFDPYSSAWSFQRWKELFGCGVAHEFTTWSLDAIEGWHAEILRPPRTWLLQLGWMRAA